MPASDATLQRAILIVHPGLRLFENEPKFPIGSDSMSVVEVAEEVEAGLFGTGGGRSWLEQQHHATDYRGDFVMAGDERRPFCRSCCTVGHTCLNCSAAESEFYRTTENRRPELSPRWTEVFKQTPRPLQGRPSAQELGQDWSPGMAAAMECSLKAHMPLDCGGVRCSVLLDTGASESFMTEKKAIECGLKIEACVGAERLVAQFADGRYGPVIDKCVRNVEWDYQNAKLYEATITYIMNLPKCVDSICGGKDQLACSTAARPRGCVFFEDLPNQVPTTILYAPSAVMTAAAINLCAGDAHLVELSPQLDVAKRLLSEQ